LDSNAKCTSVPEDFSSFRRKRLFSSIAYIRVIDAQKKNTGTSTGTLYLDHMAIKTVP